VDEEEKGRGTPDSLAALLMPLTRSRLGGIGPCAAWDAIDEGRGPSDRLCHGYRSIRHTKIYLFNLAIYVLDPFFDVNYQSRLTKYGNSREYMCYVCSRLVF
jgi:hypothetical protein